jgi:hypothetical protein
MHPGNRAFRLALTILCWVAAIGALLPATAHAALLYESGPNGYSLVLPDGWVRIPQDDVDKLIQRKLAVPGSNQSLRYDSAFQAREGMSFKLPYILVQYTPYKDGEQPNEEQMKQMMSAAAVDVEPTTEAPATFDAGNRTFDWTYETNLKDKGKARGISRGFFGRQALITVHCLMEPSEFQYNEPRYKQVLDSFRFTSFMAYKEKDPWYTTRIFRTAAGCAATIFFGGLLLHHRRKNRLAFDAMDAMGKDEATADIRDGRPYF